MKKNTFSVAVMLTSVSTQEVIQLNQSKHKEILQKNTKK